MGLQVGGAGYGPFGTACSIQKRQITLSLLLSSTTTSTLGYAASGPRNQTI